MTRPKVFSPSPRPNHPLPRLDNRFRHGRPMAFLRSGVGHAREQAMKRWIAGLVFVASAASAAERTATPAHDEESMLQARRAETLKTFRDEVTPFLKKYCIECHGKKEQVKKGGISFANTLNRPEAGEFRRHWQLSLAHVRSGAMPPEDADLHPSEPERRKFTEWIARVKYLSPRDPGDFVIRRLTKVEYGNTLRDLLGVDPSVAAALPEEVAGEGYLNAISPLQAEQYLEIANEALSRALGPPDGPATKLRAKLFGAAPAPGVDPRREAEKVARAFARSAYRRPPSDEEIAVLLRVFDLGRESKLSHPDSLRLMLKAALVSPQFLFITPARQAPADKTVVPLDDHQLASRLSYFLWSTMPDAELAALADQGKLHDPAVLRAQVTRLVQDPRSRALFDGFGVQWLGIGDLKTRTFDPAKFPEMTAALRAAMHTELRMFFESILRENRGVVSFVNSDYTFLNEPLARVYGLEKSVTGPEMRRVRLTDPNRGGVLGMPGTLAMTSFAERTSPVKRGVWVLEQVLGEHIPPAPANVPALENQNKQQVAKMTLRQRTELHRTDPACMNCHKTLDPIGFGLENFNAIGRWRTQDDAGGPIDAAGELPGGAAFSSPRELKALLAGRKEDLARNLAEKMMAYALGRPIEGYDEIVLDRLVDSLAGDGYRMRDLVEGIVTSYPFLNRRVQPTGVSDVR